MHRHPHGLRRLLLRILILASPLPAVLALYLWLDPFEVLYPHDGYYGQRHPIPVNRDFVSTELYLTNPDRNRFDSFILGNSRSVPFTTGDWTKFIDSQAAYHFDASGESLFGLWSKVRFLHHDGRRLRYVLLVIDSSTLAVTSDSPGHLFVKDPRVTAGAALPFHAEFVKAFVYPPFFARYVIHRATGASGRWMEGIFQPNYEGLHHLRETNDILRDDIEQMIVRDGEAFFATLSKGYPRDMTTTVTPSPPEIGASQERLLADIAAIFDADRTDAKVVISPTYNRKPMDPGDVGALKRRLGADRVFDFSGPNMFTDDVHSYYEPEHYRVHVARAILEIVYREKPGWSHILPR